MRRLASFIAIFVILSTAAPLMACMSASAMNPEENACCRAMHGNCGDMVKMGCCRTQVQTDEHPQLASVAPTLQVHFALVDWLAPFPAEVQAVPRPFLQIPDEHSPPNLITARITVLRI